MKRPYFAAAVAALALAMRIAMVRNQDASPKLSGDALEYHVYAVSLTQGHGFEGIGGDRASRLPGYPLFLAAVYRLAGPSPRVALWAQCVVGALTCLFLWAWASNLLESPWPEACALAAAVYHDIAAPSGWLLSEALYACLLTAAFAALQDDCLSPRRRTACASLMFGLVCLVRPELGPFALLLLGVTLYEAKEMTIRDVALAAVLFGAPVGIWTARNALVLGRFVPTTTAGGFNLYMGLRLPLEHQGLDLGPVHTAPEGLPESARDADYLAAYRSLRAGTRPSALMKAYAFNLFATYYPFLPQYDWSYALLAPLWLFGMWSARERPRLRPAAACVIWLSMVYAFLAGPVSRYRFGFAPCLLLLAAAGAAELRGRVRRPAALYACGLAWAAANAAVFLWAPNARSMALAMKARFWR